MKHRYVRIFGCAVLLLSACGGHDPNQASHDNAASAVTGAVGLSLAEMGNQVNYSGDNPRQLTGNGTFDFNNLVISCKNSGTGTVAGNVTYSIDTDANPDQLTLTYTLSDQLASCGVKAPNGQHYTLDGNLTIDGNGTITSADFKARPPNISADFSSHITGTVSVTGDQVNMTDCQVDLHASTTISGTKPNFSGSHTWNGAVCGNSTEGTFNFTKGDDGQGEDEQGENEHGEDD